MNLVTYTGYTTYQSDEYGEQLDDIRVGDTGQSAENGVEHGDATTQDDAGSLVQFDDHAQCGACVRALGYKKTIRSERTPSTLYYYIIYTYPKRTICRRTRTLRRKGRAKTTVLPYARRNNPEVDPTW